MREPGNVFSEAKNRSVIRFAVLAAVFLFAAPAVAHDSDDHDHSHGKATSRAVLSKIDEMQNSIRRKLKRVLVGDGLQQPAQSAPQRSHRSARHQGGHPTNQRPVQVANIDSDASRVSMGSDESGQIARSLPGDTDDRISMQVRIDRAQYRQTPTPVDPDFRAVGESASAEVFADHYAQPIPEPLRPISGQPVPVTRRPVPVKRQQLHGEPLQGHSQQASGDYLVQNGGSLNTSSPIPSEGPVVGGIRLGQTHITATERALDLMRENQVLRSARDSALADNQRLRDQLAAAKSLLARSNTAMTAARGELQSAEATNKSLRRKIDDLETQHKRSLIETDRILSNLRDELDEVLVNEISFNAN
jgi:hypothetical protein